MNKLDLAIHYIDNIKYINHNIVDDKDHIIHFMTDRQFIIITYNSYIKRIIFNGSLEEIYDQLNDDEKYSFLLYIENKYNVVILETFHFN